MPLFRNWRWSVPIFPAGVQWIQSPCKLPLSLANLVSQSQTPSERSDNHARNSNNKNPSPDVPQASLAANAALPLPPLALFPFAQASDRRCDTSNHGPMPVLQMLLQRSDRVLSPVQKVARPFPCLREICLDA